MATYAISDIHGAFDEFQRLLDKLNFQYDGSDSLYLLGDYGDWGAKSMETILEVKRMDEEYEFVHCLMGNHELMFLAAIEYGITEDGVRESARNWLENNHGQVTWDAYRKLPEEEQEELHSWLKQLPFSCDIEIEGRLFMAAHAYPFFDDMEATPQQRQRSRMDAVWRRLLPRENPFAAYSGVKSYSALICGHTITDYYYQETNRPAGRSLASALPVGHNRIYRAEHFIDIDCGAKCLEFEGEQGSAARAAADRAQLAAYCLETNEEFYVSRPQTVVGELMTGERSPELETPDIEFYELYPPEPDDRLWRPLELERGEVDYPELEPPQIGIPKVPELPELHLAGRGVDAAKRLVQKFLND
jgi:serine/threonine protein phosphatase 1